MLSGHPVDVSSFQPPVCRDNLTDAQRSAVKLPRCNPWNTNHTEDGGDTWKLFDNGTVGTIPVCNT
jgi:hypothetical protein